MLLTKIVQTASDLLTPQKGMNRILYDPQKVATLCNDLLKERKSIRQSYCFWSINGNALVVS